MPHLARRLFALPQDLEGAAQSWLEHGERTPRAARYASSVVLLRDSPTGLETWLGYRPGSSPLGVNREKAAREAETAALTAKPTAQMKGLLR